MDSLPATGTPGDRRPPRGVMVEALLALPNLARLTWGMLLDSRVAFFDKALVVGAIVYLVSPLDLVPDFVPFFGQIDDVVMLMIAMRRLLGRAPAEVVAAHWHGAPAWLRSTTLHRVIGALSWLPPLGKGRRVKS